MFTSACALLFALGYKTLNIDVRTVFHTLTYSDAVKAAIDLRIRESDNLFTVALLAIGALLGLLVAKPDEVHLTLKDRPELLMFLSALVLLFSSTLCHELYTTAVSEACFSGKQDRYESEGIDALAPNTKIDAVVSSPAVPAAAPHPEFVESRLTIEDLRDPAIQYLLQGQLVFVLLGLAVSACTFLSARFIKGGQTNATP